MELLIVIAILGILGVAFVPNILKAPAKARDAVRVKKVQDLHTAIEAYYAEHGSFPQKSGPAGGDFGPCADNELAIAVGMQSAPVDSNSKGSCNGGAPDAADADKYLYDVFDVTVDGVTTKHYIVGALTEVQTSANSAIPAADALNLTEVPPPVQSPADGTYFMATGPI